MLGLGSVDDSESLGHWHGSYQVTGCTLCSWSPAYADTHYKFPHESLLCYNFLSTTVCLVLAGADGRAPSFAIPRNSAMPGSSAIGGRPCSSPFHGFRRSDAISMCSTTRRLMAVATGPPPMSPLPQVGQNRCETWCMWNLYTVRSAGSPFRNVML